MFAQSVLGKGRHLYYGIIPKIEQYRWYKLRLVKTGNRLQGSLDGKVVFDVRDDPHSQSGPVLNFGRIALRHMYHTAVRYRNLVVYERTPISDQLPYLARRAGVLDRPPGVQKRAGVAL